MTTDDLIKITELFPDCTFEARDGLWIFDKNNEFVCVWLNRGFSINLDYTHSEALKKRLEAAGYKSWWHHLYEQAENQSLLDQLNE